LGPYPCRVLVYRKIGPKIGPILGLFFGSVLGPRAPVWPWGPGACSGLGPGPPWSGAPLGPEGPQMGPNSGLFSGFFSGPTPCGVLVSRFSGPKTGPNWGPQMGPNSGVLGPFGSEDQVALGLGSGSPGGPWPPGPPNGPKRPLFGHIWAHSVALRAPHWAPGPGRSALFLATPGLGPFGPQRGPTGPK